MLLAITRPERGSGSATALAGWVTIRATGLTGLLIAGLLGCSESPNPENLREPAVSEERTDEVLAGAQSDLDPDLLSAPATSEGLADPEAPPPVPPARPTDAGPLRVRIVWQVVDEWGAPIRDPQATSTVDPGPHKDGASSAFWLDTPIPFPDNLSIRVTAEGYEDAIVRPAYLRPDLDGAIDLGPVVLGEGRTLHVRVVGPQGPVDRAALHVVPAGAPFPPRAERDGYRVITRLDDPPLAWTGPDGVAVVGFPTGAIGLVVRAEEGGLGLARIEPDAVDPVIELSDEHAAYALIETDSPSRLRDGQVDFAVDFGGLRIPCRAHLGRPVRIALDAPRPITLRVDARGFEGVSTTIEAGASTAAEPHRIRLEALPFAHAVFVARDSVTKLPLDITSLRVGRARDNEPDRLDFVPDWNTVVRIDPAGATAAATSGRHDVMISADGYVETLARRVTIEGTEDEPNTVTIDLQPGPAIAGRVVRDPDQTPIAGAAVLARRVSRDLIDLPLLWRLGGSVGLIDARRTGTNGSFSVTSSAWEEVAIEVYGVGEMVRPRRFARAATAGLRIATPKATMLEGQLDPVPADADSLTAYLLDPSSPRRFRAEVRKDGSFSFAGIQPGTYQLYADWDDRGYFQGRLGGLDHSLVREMHGAPRGVTVKITGDGAALPAPPAEPRTARPVVMTVTILEGSSVRQVQQVQQVLAVRKDRQLAASRLTVADAVGMSELLLPPVGEGELVLIALDPNGEPVSIDVVAARSPRTHVTITPERGTLVVQPGGLAVDHLVATHAELTGTIARTAGLAAWSPVVVERSSEGAFRATLAAGPWLIQARDENADVIAEATVVVRAGDAVTHVLGEP